MIERDNSNENLPYQCPSCFKKSAHSGVRMSVGTAAALTEMFRGFLLFLQAKMLA
jgi:hypothetical protein